MLNESDLAGENKQGFATAAVLSFFKMNWILSYG